MKLVEFLQLGLSTHQEWTGTRKWDVGSHTWQSRGVNAEGLLSECGHPRQAGPAFREPLEKIQHSLLLSVYTSLKISSLHPKKAMFLGRMRPSVGWGNPSCPSGFQAGSCDRPLAPPEPVPPPRNQPALYSLAHHPALTFSSVVCK